MKSILKTILGLAWWIIFMALCGVVESNLPAGTLALALVGLFTLLTADSAALNALLKTSTPLASNGNE